MTDLELAPASDELTRSGWSQVLGGWTSPDPDDPKVYTLSDAIERLRAVKSQDEPGIHGMPEKYR